MARVSPVRSSTWRGDGRTPAIENWVRNSESGGSPRTSLTPFVQSRTIVGPVDRTSGDELPTAPEESRCFSAPGYRREILWVGGIFLFLMAGGFVQLAGTDAPAGRTVVALTIMVVVVGGWALYIYRCRRSRLEATRQSVRIVNPFRTYVVEWSDVDHFRAGWTGSRHGYIATLVRRDGTQTIINGLRGAPRGRGPTCGRGR